MSEKTRDLSRSVVAEHGNPAREATLALALVGASDGRLPGELILVDRPRTLGRRGTDGVDTPIDDGRISRRHALVRPRSDRSGIELEDLGSRNGVSVDGQRMPDGFVPLGSVMRLGDTVFVVTLAPWRQPKTPHPTIVGRSARLLDAVAACEIAAPSGLPVLLLGETGTGKEVFARLVHDASARRGPLVTVNCAAIPRELLESYVFGHQKGSFTGAVSDRQGFFAQAEGGTLFFDEIGDLLLELQAKLLRVLENHEYSPVGSTAVRPTDVRVVAATNADLAREVELGTFRRDLYARIAGAVVRLPPLRQRREDIPQLARHFLDTFSASDRSTFSPGFTESLVRYSWPMNVRELRMAMQRLALETHGAGSLRSAHLAAVLDAADSNGVNPPAAQATPADAPDAPVPPRAELAALLEHHHGKVAELARHYQKDRKQIYRWLRRHNLNGEDFR